ncbi:hypothetical protein K9U39_10815 [Rhodoblastus acidophilus]|uniref:Sigma-70 family RNA polymerase sigma factor n=1 Tax=Candidatus Rhodoblastus alkanivorans TaxID=2954117 RepID=A0ABS9Z8U7_9HYPH|nr:hypothetical protein [Candidatus Rhodoblastus alkanivorans]MCI4679269.1 hypothetical protein [Candidatus Rhodoblastus alkanivorans]MCI4684104.1 hypothetical protein [Candidatus Rhodoblastus alkanivorans]MDI4641424.1 hypothetical protein [Rhodoblastus acidophilus]
MGETIASATPHLRRYAHALLAALPLPAHSPRRDGVPPARADQDADDLVHEALLGFWRAGQRGLDASPGKDLRLALFRRVTLRARHHFADKAAEILAGESRVEPLAPAGERAAHFAWAPEASALPRLPLDLRAILALIALERLDYAKAGIVLDMTPERALARLVVARARLAGEMAGAARPHLVAATMIESDLHRFADDLLGAPRRAEIAAFLATRPDAARRVADWRRQSERLRGAFAPLMRQPPPLSLDFAALETGFGTRRHAAPPRGVFRRLAAFFSEPAGRSARSPAH